MMALDALTYLPDDILAKVDRASMANSLETRAPFLDVKVVEFASRIPISMKIRNGHGKWILRKVLERHVPPRLIDRPKMGFGIPLDDWLRGPLREWAEDLLNPASMAQEGYFDPRTVRQVWDAHLEAGLSATASGLCSCSKHGYAQNRTTTAAGICRHPRVWRGAVSPPAGVLNANRIIQRSRSREANKGYGKIAVTRVRSRDTGLRNPESLNLNRSHRFAFCNGRAG